MDVRKDLDDATTLEEVGFPRAIVGIAIFATKQPVLKQLPLQTAADRKTTPRGRMGVSPASPTNMWPLMILHTKSRMTPQCPLCVKSRHVRRNKPCPLYPQKRTLIAGTGMSALCQQRTFEALAIAPEKHLVFVRSPKASRWRSSRYGSSSRTFLSSSRSKAWCGNSRPSDQRSRHDKRGP